jgi:hypothetical protein
MKAENKTEVTSDQKHEETSPHDKPSSWLLCGQAGPTLLYGHWVCDHCKNVVQAEALAKRRKIDKEGGGPSS